MLRIILSTFLLFSFCILIAQTTPKRSAIINIPLAASVTVKDITTDYAPVFYNLEAPAPGSDSYRRFLIDLKEKLYADKSFSGTPTLKTSDNISAPAVLYGFNGNTMGSVVPNDNDMAISNDGKLISVINSSIYMYDTEDNDTLLKVISLSAFSDALGILGSDYDPRVVYDPRNDKFVMVFLNGYTPTTSYIIVAFSQTNDPLGAWNFYALPGNPKDNNRWTDYPMIALTENEVFITGNLIIPDEPWQTGFSETLIWQMKLQNGYIGEDIQAVFWDSVYYGGNPVRNLCPAKGGSTTYGPDLYLLSNRNFSADNDSIFIIHVTGELDDPGTTVEVEVKLSDVHYAVPPFARQFNDHEFDTNDGRILEAFYENGYIQFVGNTLEPSTGLCGIYHGVITDLDGEKIITGNILGSNTLDFGYPDISYTGNYDGDIQSIIICDHSSPDVYAGMSAFYYNGGYSKRVTVKQGETYVNVLTGPYERWGDYTGSQKKYNETGVIWVSGNYGKLVESGPLVNHNNGTWISKLQSGDSSAYLNIASQNTDHTIAIYPNPAENIFTSEMELHTSGEVFFILYDAEGNIVKELLATYAQSGKNKFSFSTQHLSAGMYFLHVQFNGEVMSVEKVIRQ